MSDPTQVNQVATIVNKALSAGLQVEESTLEATIIAQVPALGLPVIKQIMELGLDWIEKQIYTQAAIRATQVIIDLQTDFEASKAQSAFDAVTKAVASGDQSAIDKASSDLDSAFASVIHYDGSATP